MRTFHVLDEFGPSPKRTHAPSSCKPQIAQKILSEPGMQEALDGKLLISILAGVTIAQLEAMVLPSTKVVRAMPNTPCKVRPSPSRFGRSLTCRM